MSLKTMFSAMKKEGYVVKPLELYLLSLSATDSDRAINVNAPSAIGTCLRSRYYTRTNAESDSYSVDARTRRIFDNGSGVHERLQTYLKDVGILLMDEVPVLNETHNIQGHTDGILKLSDRELGVLEIKSINSKGFNELKSEKPEHNRQGLIYVYCLEQWRLMLKEKYKTEKEFKDSSVSRSMYYHKFYTHLKDGRKFTAKEKIRFQVQLLKQMDEILFHCDTPITKCIFLYENKDTQDLKEYCVSSKETQSESNIKEMLEECDYLNDIIENNKEIPPRCASNKSDNACRWCRYKTECWN